MSQILCWVFVVIVAFIVAFIALLMVRRYREQPATASDVLTLLLLLLFPDGMVAFTALLSYWWYFTFLRVGIGIAWAVPAFILGLYLFIIVSAPKDPGNYLKLLHVLVFLAVLLPLIILTCHWVGPTHYFDSSHHEHLRSPGHIHWSSNHQHSK